LAKISKFISTAIFEAEQPLQTNRDTGNQIYFSKSRSALAR